MVTLKEISRENIDEVLALKVDEDQRSFVSTNAESLAQAYVYKETAYPFAVYDDDVIVGFIMMGYYEAKEYYTLGKLMIDKRYQNKRKTVGQNISVVIDYRGLGKGGLHGKDQCDGKYE